MRSHRRSRQRGAGTHLKALSETADLARSPASKFRGDGRTVIQIARQRRILARVEVAGEIAMNEHTTPSILQRVPVILAVTAASYGLPLQAQGRSPRPRTTSEMSSGAIGCGLDRPVRESITAQH
jgi:hypothetical protein